RTGGVTRTGLDADGATGGGAVDGIVATPDGTVVGGNGGPGGAIAQPGQPGTAGGNGFLVVFW
ncbi:hypothetical protein LG632_24335, partial [Streptomyces sp. SMC 277]|nr:hypothetical protein [Streptomyces antimicrobicus]